MGDRLQILNLGAGVQSTTLLLMSCYGHLPKLDAAVFADTQWEPAEVYQHLGWLEQVAAEHGIPVTRVTAGNLREHSVQGFIGAGIRRGREQDGRTRYASIPLYVLNGDGTKGMVRRQCTSEYKIEPIERWVKRELLGLKPRQHAPREPVVDQWFGISSDEASRIRMPREPWKRHVYPLCNMPTDMMPSVMSRQACIEWLRVHATGRNIPKSACIGCPYRDNKSWRHLRDQHPEEWADAVEVDRSVRHANKLDGQAFLHRSCEPLEEAPIDQDASQNTFGWDEECLGYCGN